MEMAIPDAGPHKVVHSFPVLGLVSAELRNLLEQSRRTFDLDPCAPSLHYAHGNLRRRPAQRLAGTGNSCGGTCCYVVMHTAD